MSIIGKLITKFNDSKTVSFEDIDAFSGVSTWISTGSPSLDYHLHTWGYPTGIIEIRGVSKSGKTTLTLHAIKSLQMANPDAIVVVLSSERRDNKIYGKQLGVKTGEVLVHQVATIESVFNRIQQTITHVEEIWKKEEREGKPKYLFVWDSLGATISTQEKDKMQDSAKKDDEDQHKAAMGSAARALKRGLRYITGEVYNHDICFLIINHSYNKIGGFIPGRESYGGEGIQYHPTMRLEATYTGFVKIGDEKVGQTTNVTVIKSDFTSDLSKHEIEIGFGLGLILTDADLEFGFEAGILEKVGKTGASFMKGKLKWKNRRELYDLYKEKNKFLQILINKLTKLAHKKVVSERNMSDTNDETED